MMTLNIAGIPVGVENRYSLPEWSCEQHKTTGSPVFTVSATEKEIQEEYEKLKGEFSIESCESNCLYRKICAAMPMYNAFLLHAVAVAVDGEGYAFAAPSGTGKSTHAFYWLREFGDRAVIINGDKPLIRHMDGKFYIYGTPWRGKERLGNADTVPLKAVCLLERGAENEIAPAGEDTVIDRIFRQVLLLEEPEQAVGQLDLIDRLIREVPIYQLKCNMTQQAAVVAYNGMNQL